MVADDSAPASASASASPSDMFSQLVLSYHGAQSGKIAKVLLGDESRSFGEMLLFPTMSLSDADENDARLWTKDCLENHAPKVEPTPSENTRLLGVVKLSRAAVARLGRG